MFTYQKIETVFMRDEHGTKKLIEGQYRDRIVEYIKDCEWEFTEKIDGTNIGIYWDGHKVHYQGRTEKASIPAFLLDRLMELFGGETNEELFEQLFGDKEVVLFGEGYGKKIQKCGAQYKDDGTDFILFDVYMPKGDLYLERGNVENIAETFKVDVVPIVLTGTIDDAIRFVKEQPDSTIGTAKMEGLVGRPAVGLKNRKGERVIVKVKVRDFV